MGRCPIPRQEPGPLDARPGWAERLLLRLHVFVDAGKGDGHSQVGKFQGRALSLDDGEGRVREATGLVTAIDQGPRLGLVEQNVRS